MAFISRNPTPYATKMAPKYNHLGYKSKVSGYEKPTQAIRRNKQMKKPNDFQFQNAHQNGKGRFHPYMATPNISNSKSNKMLPSDQSKNFIPIGQDIFDSVPNTISFGYPASKCRKQHNISQGTPNEFSRLNKNIPSSLNFSLKPASSDHHHHRHHEPVNSNSLRGASGTLLSQAAAKQDANVSNISSQQFQLTETTNKLLLSLDSSLIDLISKGSGLIPPLDLADKGSLKIRRQNVIDALYNKEDKQCANCGLRFPKEKQEALADHLDEHFRQAVELKRTIKRRAWYHNQTTDQSNLRKFNKEDARNPPDELLPMVRVDEIMIALNEDITKCKLCCEEFEQVFIDDQDHLYTPNREYRLLKEGWYLKNAIWSGSDLIHPTCSNEAFEATK